MNNQILPDNMIKHINKQIDDYKKKYPHNWYDDNKKNNISMI